MPIDNPNSEESRMTAPQKQKPKPKEIPGKLEYYDGQLREVVDASRSGWWRFHKHYDRDGYCDNPARGY
jgi:hypothetical protein